MQTNTPWTISKLLMEVQTDRLVLPSIQRSFVWSPKQIIQLFDSLMRGYPIGTFLVWQTVPSKHPNVRFHRLHTDYDSSGTHAAALKPKSTTSIRAVLDGQQRVTAINIGVRGSIRGGWTAPQRRLFIDVSQDDESAGSEDHRYRFEFAHNRPSSDGDWLLVSEALYVADTAADASALLKEHGLPHTPQQRRVLRRLIRVLNDEPTIHLAVERSDDLDRVLHVFARTNMGGTKLTYVELLVSTAAAKMKHVDPSIEFPQLRTDLRNLGIGLTIDRILKAAFVLTGSSDPKFHVEKMLTSSNMAKLETAWPDIARSVKVAVQLLGSFGLSQSTLAAENAVLPVASYAYLRGLQEGYIHADARSKDRDRVRAFVARTLLQRGYWTGAVDRVLVDAHKVIRTVPGKTFPLDALAEALRTTKPIDVDDNLLDELCQLPYGDRRTKVLLTLLFPHMATRGVTDKDHIFPRSRVNYSALFNAGVPPDRRELALSRVDSLPNLQLVASVDNKHKGVLLPAEWLATLGPTAKSSYTRQGVKHLPTDLAGFNGFWEKRRAFLRSHIERLLCP